MPCYQEAILLEIREIRENREFSPDFWVNPDDSLDIAVRFIDRYLK